MVSVQQEGVIYSKNDQFVALVLLVVASSFRVATVPANGSTVVTAAQVAHSTVQILASRNMTHVTLNVN
jgi:hypothetical protein